VAAAASVEAAADMRACERVLTSGRTALVAVAAAAVAGVVADAEDGEVERRRLFSPRVATWRLSVVVGAWSTDWMSLE